MSTTKPKYLGIDIGGTWIKGTIVDEDFFKSPFSDLRSPVSGFSFQIEKVKSPLHANAKMREFVEALQSLISHFNPGSLEIKGIGISTAGIVNYHGTKILKAAAHLNLLKNYRWKAVLEERFKCSVTLINDGEAAAIGLAESGFLFGNKTIGIMPIGTGLGFTVWRNGRRWRPGKSLTLLGSIRTPGEMYDSVASAAKLAELDESHNLVQVLTNESFKEEREEYLNNLAKIINTAAILYTLDEVIICGGLADAVNACQFPLDKLLSDLLDVPVELEKSVKVIVSPEGNRLQLIGALAMAKGESVAMENKFKPEYDSLETEIPYKSNIQLQNLPTLNIIETLWQAEQEAGDLLKSTLPLISAIADESVERIRKGGRIIYVGAGTSGRIAAMDAVEIPCTYGFPEDRIIALISGGISDASIEIESDFEEDASSVPEMLLLNVQPEDVVIGISASGTAYYVQSALAFAKDRHALSIMIQAKNPEENQPAHQHIGTSANQCDYIIPLNSGNEVVAGSTRMKAGTATKKVLNFLSSTIMIKMGKVAGPYMIDVACINNKLIERAQNLLRILYNVEGEEALEKLKNAGMSLRSVIRNIEENQSR